MPQRSQNGFKHIINYNLNAMCEEFRIVYIILTIVLRNGCKNRIGIHRLITDSRESGYSYIKKLIQDGILG